MEKYSEIRVMKGPYKGWDGTVVLSDKYRSWCKLVLSEKIVLLRTNDLQYRDSLDWEVIEDL